MNECGKLFMHERIKANKDLRKKNLTTSVYFAFQVPKAVDYLTLYFYNAGFALNSENEIGICLFACNSRNSRARQRMF